MTVTIDPRGDSPLDPHVHQLLLAQYGLGPLPDGMTEAGFYDRVDELREIIQCCAYANLPDQAKKLAKQGATIAQARVALFDILADRDEASVVDTAQRLPTDKSAADIWAARRSPASLGSELQGVWATRAAGESEA